MFGRFSELKEIRERLTRIEDSVSAIEGMVIRMPTRAEFDAAKAALGQAISDAATRVTTDIQKLRDQLAAGNPITDQDLADLQADVSAVGNIDPAVVPPPSP